MEENKPPPPLGARGVPWPARHGPVVVLCVARQVTRLQAQPSGVWLITFLRTLAWKVISLKARGEGGSGSGPRLPAGLGRAGGSGTRCGLSGPEASAGRP